MKKFILLAAMLALAVALAVPAIAQVGLETGNESSTIQQSSAASSGW
jgi:hypothetical protein